MAPIKFPIVKVFRLVAAFVFLIICPFAALAQRLDYFPYHSKDTTHIHELALLHKNRVKEKLTVPKEVNNDYKNHFKRITNNLSEDAYNSIRYGALIDTVVYPYIQGVFQNILKANPDLAGTELILSKSPEPNAFALPNGSIHFNIGLIAKLENESQLVSVLCHELAHVKLQHLERGLNQILASVHNKEVKKEVRKIVRGKYNVNAKIGALALGVSLDNLYHNRAHETQADSLGYLFFINTNYDISQATRLFDVLRESDEPVSKANIDFGRYFNCADHQYPFQSIETAKPKSIFAVKLTEEEENLEKSDSLRTHPNCDKRKAYILNLAKSQSKTGGPVTTTNNFAKAAQVCRFEVIQSCFDFGYYDHAFFDALKLLEEQPDNIYLRSMALICLYKFKMLSQKHLFAEMISPVSKYNSDNFNHMLGVINRFSISDYKNLATCFYNSSPVPNVRNEYTMASQYAFFYLSDKIKEADEVKKQYNSAYSGGKFSSMMRLPVDKKKK